MPSEMSFSLWFFYLFWKAERVFGNAVGLTSLPGFPYDGQQGIGACLAIAFFALVGARQHLLFILKGLFRHQTRSEGNYRWAASGLILGLVFLAVLSYRGGMAVWAILLYFLVYYLLSISIARIRSEVGPPTHEMFNITPRRFLIDLLGTKRFSHGSLTMMSMFFTFNRGSRAHPMPHIMEGFKLAHESKMSQRRLIPVIMLSVVVGSLFAFWAYLFFIYKIGADTIPHADMAGTTYNSLRNWIQNPSDTSVTAVVFVCIGFTFTSFIWWMRRLFPLWPFHPAGYALASSTWTFGWLWFSVFVSWAIKTTLLKIGGVKLYRKAYPLFLGLILGEFLAGGTWVLIRLFTGIEVYSFFR